MIQKDELESKIQDLEKYIISLKCNKSVLSEFYNQEYKNYKDSIFNDLEGTFKFSSITFEELFNKVICFVEKQKQVLIEYSKIKATTKKNKISKFYNNILNEFNFPYDTSYLLKNSEDFNTFVSVLGWKNLAHDYGNITLLKKFSDFEENIILIGGNGKGKSSLANYLKGGDFASISVVGAQKTLYFSTHNTEVLKTEKREITEILLDNSIKKSKNDEQGYDFFHQSSSQFTKLIIAMQSEYTNYLYLCDSNNEQSDTDKTVFGKVRKLYKSLFNDIELVFKMGSRTTLEVVKDGRTYSVNGLSEGEKAVLYYAISVLMAKEDGLIIVDEPETYLNPALSNLLWDRLIEAKKDSQFLFITHSVDFVLGRDNAQVSWIRNFEYPDKWDIELLQSENNLPKLMLTEILGSSKPLLFCEGNDKSSLDYHIYKSIFGENYTIIPSDGHKQVVNYVRSVKKIGNIQEVYGIIDLDSLSENEKNKFEKEGIKVLEFNEIEMLFFEEHVMMEVMRSIYPTEYKEKIETFKLKFHDIIKNSDEKIALAYVKKRVENYLMNEKIQDYSSLEQIRDGLTDISNYDISNQYEEKKKRIKAIIDDNTYPELLKVCNLKTEISKGLANKYLDNNYIEKAKQRILTDTELKEYLVKKYFSFLGKV
ncbi:AAA family ATPase [Streptococcus suis]|uniref:AAA family ATPase n=1 Tax=Streptococcus suis TaxID=1307 RepID=UPI0004073F6F|nr:AAA family ATPase [Streptococcus suis]